MWSFSVKGGDNSKVSYLWIAFKLSQIMKLTVLKGPEPGAITPREIVERHRAEAPQFQNHEKICYCCHWINSGANPIVTHFMGASLLWRLCCCYTGPYSLTVWQSQIELSHEKTENHKAWLPVHSVGSWTLPCNFHVTSHRQAMDCYHKWYASHWRYKELRRTESKGSELFKKGMQVMEAVSIIIVGLMTAMWLFIIVGLVCCHVFQRRERRRLKQIHASYFKQ